MTIEELAQKVEELEKKVEHPISFNFRKALEQADFEKMTIRKLIGGLPVFTSARTDTPKDGEVWILNGSIQFYVDGVTYTLTPPTP